MSIQDYIDYREYLRDLLEVKSSHNPSYSLRAFARDLDLRPSQLSDILKNKKGVSLDAAVKIGHRLKLKEAEIAYFCDLVLVTHSKSKASKKIATLRVAQTTHHSQYKLLHLDTMKVISEWYHLAILELTALQSFKSDTKWMAKKLGISLIETQQAIARLKRLELLSEENGQLKKTEKYLTTPEDIPSEGIKKFNRQVIKKSLRALEEAPVEERNFSTITMIIDPSKIKEAKQKISTFNRELANFLESDRANELYCFSNQLFKLTES